MVQCVSSSEQDMAESREHAWPVTRNDFNSDTDTQSKLCVDFYIFIYLH